MLSVSRAVSAWPSRWLTATSGFRSARARALPVVRPTMTPPTSPGPAAAAMPSRSSSAISALYRARSTSRSMTSTWARAAISGTTPPKAAWSAIWLMISFDRISPPPSSRSRTTLAADSSQVVSMPRTRIAPFRRITWSNVPDGLASDKARRAAGAARLPKRRSGPYTRKVNREARRHGGRDDRAEIGNAGKPPGAGPGVRDAQSARDGPRMAGGDGRRSGDPHDRRCDPGSCAGRSRRQGAFHQGTRYGAAGRRHRHRGSLGQGPADAAAARHRAGGFPAARRRARRVHLGRWGQPRRLAAPGRGGFGIAAATSSAAPHQAGPRCPPAPGQRADAAPQGGCRRVPRDHPGHGGPEASCRSRPA